METVSGSNKQKDNTSPGFSVFCWPQLGRWEDCYLPRLTITDIIKLRSSSLKVNREFQSRVTLWQPYIYVLLASNIFLNCNSVLLPSYKNGHLEWGRATATHEARGDLSCDSRWGHYHNDEMIYSELRNWKDQVNKQYGCWREFGGSHDPSLTSATNAVFQLCGK